ncbi:MAG: 50S ribosomal protein L25, partial [bacterium]|nr:50S ribosomal protein L25 [bacterium]
AYLMQSIVAERRDILGKKTATLRKKGFLPGVVYGKGSASENITVKEGEFLKLWRSAGEATIVSLEVGKEKKNVLIHDVAIDPLKDVPIHVDFYIVDMLKMLKVDVPLEFVGESEAVKAGGILVKVHHALEIEALPKDLPRSIIVDISVLKTFEDKITVGDLKIPSGVKVIKGLEETVVLVEPPRAAEEVVAAEAAPDLANIERVEKKAKAEGEAEEGEEKSEAAPSKPARPPAGQAKK